MIRFLFLFLLTYSSLFALNSINISRDGEQFTNFNIEYANDPSNSLSLQEARKKLEFKSNSNKISVKSFNQTNWIKFKIYNSTNHVQKYFVYFSETTLDKLVCYTISHTKDVSLQNAGIQNSIDNKSYKVIKPKFEINLKKNELKTIYIKISNPHSISYQLDILDSESIEKRTTANDNFYLLFFGLLIVLIVYNLFMYVTDKNAAYLYYVIYVSSLSYWQLTLNAIAPFNLFSSSEYFYYTSLTTPSLIIIAAFFVRKIIDLKKLIPNLDKMLIIAIFLYIILSIIVYFETIIPYRTLNIISVAILGILIISSFIVYVKKGNTSVLLITTAQLIFFSAYLMFFLMSYGLIEYDAIYKDTLYLGAFLEIMIFSFALRNRSKHFKSKMRIPISGAKQEALTSNSAQNEAFDETKSYKYIFNNTIEAIIIFKEGVCIDLNEEALKLFDFYDENKVIGIHIDSFIVNDSLKKLQEDDTKYENTVYEAQAIKSTKEVFPVLYKSHYYGEKDAKLQITSYVDLSSIKEKELSLTEAKTKAEESTKIKSEFLANMSHEIRTPMNGIIGMSHLIQQTKLDNKQKNFIKKIDDSAKALLSVINDILDHSKMEAGKLIIVNIPFDINELIEDTINVLQIRAQEKEIEIKIIFKGDSFSSFYGDSLRIGQVLKNLLSNAIKFTQEGYVEITVERTAEKLFQFSVKDSGIGISPEQQEKLFHEFIQADSKTARIYGGTGLGLTISKKLVELMDGKIWLESEVGIGSVFTFEIPLIELEKDSISLKTKKIDPHSINILVGSKILLVDDNSINQEIILGILENSGIRIDIANNGQEAIDKFQTNKYELIFMDIHMPIMNGYEATTIIKESDKEIPIIALTANAMKEDVEKALAVGMNEHLSKPIDINKLYEVLLKYLSQKVDSYDSEINEDSIVLPNFKHINTEAGLHHIGGNARLYLQILRNFYNQYLDFKIDEKDAETFNMQLHTLKGLSASIGALSLNEVLKRVDASRDNALLKLLYVELNLVIDELAALHTEINGLEEELLVTTDYHIEELFDSLRESINENRPKKVSQIIDEISKYELSTEFKELFNEVSKLALNYEYEKVETLL